MLKATAAVRAGGLWVQREALARAVQHARRQVTREFLPGPPLDPREQEALELLATGMSTALIAEALHIAESTVRVQLLRAVEKPGAASRTDAVRRPTRWGLADP